MLAGGIAMALLSLSLYLFRELRQAEQHPSWAISGRISGRAAFHEALFLSWGFDEMGL